MSMVDSPFAYYHGKASFTGWQLPIKPLTILSFICIVHLLQSHVLPMKNVFKSFWDASVNWIANALPQ